MTLGKCFQLWFGLLVVCIVLILVFISPTWLSGVVAREVAESRMTVGSKDTDRVVAATNEWYLCAFERHEMRVAQTKAKTVQHNGARTSIALNRLLAGAVERFDYIGYLIMFRLQWLVEAGMPILLFVIAAAIDGLAIRRRRAYTFAYTSTVVYNASSYVVLTVAFLPLIYLIAPVVVPVTFLPFAGIGIAAAVWVFFAHLPGAAPMIGMRT